MTTLKRFKRWLFHQVHSKNLVYNTCWEDPRCDRKLMDIDENSEIVMITSAGCNALGYLLDQPRKIYCIDINERQNALLELKLALFRKADFDTLFQFFGLGRSAIAKYIYETKLRPVLSVEAQLFWDKKIYYFSKKGWRKSFYFHGTSGWLAWLTKGYFKTSGRLHQQVQALMAATSIDQQRVQYTALESRLFTPFVEWLLNRHLIMSMAGMPQSQQALFVDKYETGVMGYVGECLKNVFTKLPVRDNYFWKVYLNGQYTKDCCPAYLKATSFEILKKQVDKVKIRTTSISQFLTHNPGQYSHFVLLDHQDWLATHDVQELENEWRLILQNSKKGTKILLRSAAEEIDFFPDFVKEKVHFQREEILAIHQEDRVGTYASTYLGIVQ
ncbi:MAG: BtaA family protein [Bacteroidota bacterium]